VNGTPSEFKYEVVSRVPASPAQAAEAAAGPGTLRSLQPLCHPRRSASQEEAEQEAAEEVAAEAEQHGLPSSS